jgi:single-stranded-DNA-specific exonuclease
VGFYTQVSNPLWVYPPSNEELVDQIVKNFHIHKGTAQILVSRGFTEIEQIHDYLYGRLPDLHDPSIFLDMNKAIERIIYALDHKEGILIYGDNDVDGMTGTALLTEFLRFIGARVFFYVPNRTSLTQNILLDALDYALKNSCKLIVTVDCGITAAKEIAKVAEKNVDVIVTDHHEPTAKIPHCLATLNPKVFDSVYPNREITGVGVAFKLAHALTSYLVEHGYDKAETIDLKSYLDLVALGTIADMGSLLGENRILVRYGLKQLDKTQRVGLVKLLEICELNIHELSSSDVASKIAPRLNSLGRIADPRKGVELLLIKDPITAAIIAKELDLNNIERKKIERKVSVDVDSSLSECPELVQDKAIILSSTDWHPGVIAIVTSRIAKTYHRPTILISSDGNVGKGSARTIREFPLLTSLKECSDILINFGGHDFAAGLTIKHENIPEFTERFIQSANAQLADSDVISKLKLDTELNFDALTFNFMESLNLLEPHGNENPQPIMYCKAKQIWPPKLVGKLHLKFYLEQEGRVLEGIGFGMGDRRDEFRKKGLKLEIAYTPQINTFQNKSSIQLLIRDCRIASEIK